MTPVNDKILVSCNMKQKDEMTIGGITIKCANDFDVNYRERSPVIVQVVQGNKRVKEGDILLVHHNTLYTPSPYFVQDNLFSIPTEKIIFGKLTLSGDFMPLYGTIICERVNIETDFPLPAEYQKQYTERVRIINGGDSEYKQGQIVFTRPYSYYEVVYIFGGIQKRVFKIHKDMICGYLK